MAPGTKRPPPIGSELVITGLPDGAECRRAAGVGAVCSRGTGGVAGARVWRFVSSRPTSPKTVASGSDPTGVPHFAQNRALSETVLPQEMQYMKARFYHSALGPANLRTDSADPFDLHGCAVRQNLCHALHHFIGVVAHR